jgi:hypothetical protein
MKNPTPAARSIAARCGLPVLQTLKPTRYGNVAALIFATEAEADAAPAALKAAGVRVLAERPNGSWSVWIAV